MILAFIAAQARCACCRPSCHCSPPLVRRVCSCDSAPWSLCRGRLL
jgi:hypothetical protein